MTMKKNLISALVFVFVSTRLFNSSPNKTNTLYTDFRFSITCTTRMNDGSLTLTVCECMEMSK